VTDSDLEETIRTAAAEPASASADGQSATAQPLRDLIDADKYLATKAAARAQKPGIRFAKFIPPGMT
jgi:hypothetical protein